MKVGFTPKQVTRLTGVPYSTLNLWANKGLIRPSIAEGAGSGSERVYSFQDLVALRVAFALRKAGVTTPSIVKVVQFLHEHQGMEQPLAEARLIVSGRDVVAARNDEELMSVLSKPGQGCLSFVVDLPSTLGKLLEIAHKTDAFALGLVESEGISKDTRKEPLSVIGNRRQRVPRANRR